MTPYPSVPVRRLPIPVPPVANETTASYLRRLAALNHLPFADLEDAVAIGKRSVLSRWRRAVAVVRLGGATGYAPDKLERALPDLRSPHPRNLPRSLQLAPLAACSACVRRHRGGVVMVYLPEHRHVCVRHDIWLGSVGPAEYGPTEPEGPVDVRPLPIIRSAQRRHQRLVRRYGETATFDAVRTAREIWDRNNQPRFLSYREWDWLRVFRPGADEVSLHDPLAHAIRYPTIVTIAGVLASPVWQAAASDWATRHDPFDEVGRRVSQLISDDDFPRNHRWRPPKRHPLTYWAEGLQEQRRRAEREANSPSARIRFTRTDSSWMRQ
jgi:hypothetical protein